MATHERPLRTVPGFVALAVLLVVLVSGRGAQPVVNSGSLHT
jgi:hypothetical protein